MQVMSRTEIKLPEFQEHDRILQRLLALRTHEWLGLRGIRRVIARIKIEIWAWRETTRELRRTHGNDPHRV